MRQNKILSTLIVACLFLISATSLVLYITITKTQKKLEKIQDQMKSDKSCMQMDVGEILTKLNLSLGGGVTKGTALNGSKQGLYAQSRSDVLSSILAEKVESLVEGASTDQEKCIRIAKWISANISNRKSGNGKDILYWYAHRIGTCGERATIFVKMLELQGIKAGIFNILNFGAPGNGHSCAQAFYDGGWHFFDVTYAGVFINNEKVLSWEEIKAEPELAVKSLVVFEQTIDRINADLNEEKANNAERMKFVYTVETINGARTYGFFQGNDLKTLYPKIDAGELSKNPLIIGVLNKSIADVTAEGLKKNVSQQLGVSLGNATDTYHTSWEFENCKPGDTYVIRYHLFGSSRPGLNFWARATNAVVTKGGAYLSLPKLFARNPDTWEIIFVPEKANCSITVGYDFRNFKAALLVDQIEILKK